MLSRLKDTAMWLGNGVLTGTLGEAKPQTDEERWQRIAKMFAKYRAKAFAEVATVTSEKLVQELREDNKPVLVDCRPRNERVSTIPGSVHDFDPAACEPGTEVVVFCTIGYRSGVFGKKLMREHPELRVRNLEGGILGWCHRGGGVVDQDQHETKTVHVYGPTWDLLPGSYEAVVGEEGALKKL